ncbi:response regulator [Reyranella sp. CPCC 100927]|uniref:response regulator n=1 Tax=Reyranella sp. CPCC 100927 TaxID=2599616 RepID=UPI0011B571D5|nr:response regulator [Reyranella sp. CPCC 100927]TWS94446.1 DNA-binding response regulator [Reyranella sp. CPCC 100927]
MSSRVRAGDFAGDTSSAFSVLLVDDDTDLLDEMATTLSREGFSILQASDGATAIDLFDSDPTIGVLVSDVRMPGLDGLQLVETLRARLSAGRPGPQVIFLTGHGTMEYAVHALRLRADDFLYKPMSRADLVAAVRRAAAACMRVRGSADGLPAMLSQSSATVTRLFAGGVRSGIAAPERTASPSTSRITTPRDRSDQIRAMLHERKVRTRLFDGSALADPNWDMMLDLMLAHVEDRKTYLFSLCAASGLPVTNAKRRIEQLIAAGLVQREDDQTDRRRVLLRLTDTGLERLSAYIDQIEPGGARLDQT